MTEMKYQNYPQNIVIFKITIHIINRRIFPVFLVPGTFSTKHFSTLYVRRAIA